MERYYSDPQRWALTFQLNALHSRSKLWEESIKIGPNEIHFSERSPLADRNIFGEIMNKEGNFTPTEYVIYDTLCKEIMSKLPLKAIIYLKCSPELCI